MNKPFLGLLLILSLAIGILPASAQEEATQEADTVSEKIQEKIEAASQIPVAYMGTITDIAEATIQTKTTNGEIKQVQIDADNTDFVKVDKTSKAVAFKDIAIGDFIVAMGYKNGNDVLETTRLLVTSALEPTDRGAVVGVVTNVTKTEITLNSLEEEKKLAEAKVSLITMEEEGEQTEIDFSDIEVGDKIIAVGLAKNQPFEARRIHVTSRRALPESSPTPTPEEE